MFKLYLNVHSIPYQTLIIGKHILKTLKQISHLHGQRVHISVWM